MYISFEQLPSNARIWIYQANRSLTTDELQITTQKITDFITSWQAHQKDLVASFELKYKRFIVIGVDVDKHSPTGCSIDASVKCIQDLERDFNIDLMDRINVSFKQGEFVAYKNLKDFRKMIKAKSVTSKTIVFNNLVTNKEEYQTQWEVPMKDSWHNRYL